MADSTSPAVSSTSPVAGFFWKFLRGTFMILIVSRFYALLMYFDLAPEYPDPIMEFLGATYTKLDQLFEGRPATSPTTELAKLTIAEQVKQLGLVSIVVGNLVFGALLRYYKPSFVPAKKPEPAAASNENSKKQQKKQSLLREVVASKALAQEPKPELSKEEQAAKSAIVRRNIIIVGRLGQCAVLLGKAINGDEKHANELLRHIINASMSVGLTLAELRGIKWDGGVLDRFFTTLKRNETVKEVKEKAAKVEEDVKLKLR